MRKFWGAWSLSALAAAMMAAGGAGVVASAQEEGAPPRRAEAQPAEPATEAGETTAASVTKVGERRESAANRMTDSYLATCLLIDNQAEAALGQFAQQRAESDDVRKFAEKMAQEHQQMADSLKRFAQADGAAHNSDASGQRATGAPREEGAPARAATTRQAQAPAATDRAQATTNEGAIFLTIKREVAEQCLQSAQKELGAKKGEDFDKCYITSQVAMHQHALDTMQVFEKHAGKEFRPVLAQGIQSVKEHLEEAKAIAKKLDGATGEVQARNN